MNYKRSGLLFCIVMILLAAAVPYVNETRGTSLRVHQHREAKLRPEDEVDDGTFNTHLPLVILDTGEEEIPGVPILDEYGVNLGFTMTETGEKMASGVFSIMDNEEQIHRTTDKPDMQSNMLIRCRGNHSRDFDKHNYLVRLVDENGDNNPKQLAGMAAHHEWALHGPFRDKSLIRNYMAYNLAGISWIMRQTFVSVNSF